MSSVGWVLLIIALIVLAILVWQWWRRGTRRVAMSQEQPPAAAQVVSSEMTTMTTTPPDTAAVADDLTILEGIGPKVASILKAAGITTFAQLAATDLTTLKDILKANGMSYLDPETWPEQAKLAAAGKVAELRALQDSLKGGRRA